MSNDTTQHTPADVRERIKAAIRDGVRYVAKADGAYLYEPSVDETADRILSLLRTPRGEGEADTLWRDFEAALVEFEGEAIALGRREALPLGPREAAIDRVVQARRRVIACAHVLAALRSDAQEEDRWEDVVFGPITEAYHEAHAARRGEGGGDG